MKTIKYTSGYAHKVLVVLLQDDEAELPDEVLAMMADGRPRETAVRVHKDNGHPGHFGASVERRFGKTNKNNVYCRIKIYTD